MPWIIGGAVLGGALLSSNASKSAAQTQANAAGQASQVQQNMFDQTQQNMAPWMQTGKVALGDLSTMLGLKGSTASLESNPAFAQFRQQQLAEADAAHQAKFGMSIQDPRSGWSAPGQKEQWEQGVKQQFMQQNPGADGSNDPNFGKLTKPFGLSDFQESPAYQFNLAEGEKAINKAAAARGKFYAPGTLQDISKFSQGMASIEFQNSYNNYNTNMGNIWNRLSNLSSGGQNASANLGGFGQNAAGQIGNNITGAANASAAGQVGSANAISGGIGNAYNNYMMQQILANNQQSSLSGNADPNLSMDAGASLRRSG